MARKATLKAKVPTVAQVEEFRAAYSDHVRTEGRINGLSEEKADEGATFARIGTDSFFSMAKTILEKDFVGYSAMSNTAAQRSQIAYMAEHGHNPDFTRRKNLVSDAVNYANEETIAKIEAILAEAKAKILA